MYKNNYSMDNSLSTRETKERGVRRRKREKEKQLTTTYRIMDDDVEILVIVSHSWFLSATMM